MIEDILKKLQDISEVPSYKKLETALPYDLCNERDITEIEFRCAKLLVEKDPTNNKKHWESLKQRWRDRWC